MSNYRRLFIDGYNYVFITIVTYDRQNILIDNIELLRKAFVHTKKKFLFDIIAIVVLPEHLHFILKIENVMEYPKIVYSVKFYFSIHLDKNKNISISKNKKGEKGIWQRRYWEHIIRNQEDLYKHLDYIHYNPVKHNYTNSVKDYKYSSFGKFVKLGYYDRDWCNFEDKNGILRLEFE